MRNEITMEEDQELRQQAIVRLKKKSDFKAHLLAYVLVNAFLLVIWAATGAGFPWPIFPIFGWGIGVAFNAWDAYGRTTPTESEIAREMNALRHSGI
jgi:2TM domain